MRTVLLISFVVSSLGLFAQNSGVDSSFAIDGKLIVDGLDSLVAGDKVLIEARSNGLVLAINYQDTSLVQLIGMDHSGAVDSAFGVNGTLLDTAKGSLLDIESLDDGLLLLYQSRIDMRDNEGVLDSSFAINGTFQIDSTEFLSVGVSPDQHIYVLCRDSLQDEYLMLRLTNKGIPDKLLALDGQVTLDHESSVIKVDESGELVLSDSTGVRMYGPYAASYSDSALFVLPGAIQQLEAVSSTGQVLFSYEQIDSLGGVHRGLAQVPNEFAELTLGQRVYTGVLGSREFFRMNESVSPADTTQSGIIQSVSFDHHGYVILASNTSFTQDAGWLVSRLDPQLNNDTSFGTFDSLRIQYAVNTTFHDGLTATPNDILVLENGDFMVAGNSRGKVVVARYNGQEDPRSTMRVRVMLAGPFNVAFGYMNNRLGVDSLVPIQSPYAPFETSGTSVRVQGFSEPGQHWNAYLTPEIYTWTGDSALVDWIWLELVNAYDTSKVVGTMSAALRRDGQVIRATGQEVLDWGRGSGPFFLRVAHRNHFPVMNKDTLWLDEQAVLIDFTDSTTNTFGLKPQLTIGGIEALYPGDVNHDGKVKYLGAGNDRDIILVEIGGSIPTTVVKGYSSADINMDGAVKYLGLRNDRDIILQVLGGSNPVQVLTSETP